MRIELLNIGTELLMGFVVNSHAAYLGRGLNQIGGTLTRQVCVNDVLEDMGPALRDALARAELVITTGGLGPTSDDVTRDLVVKMFNLSTHLDDQAFENIQQRHRRRSLNISDSVKSQAIVPDIATVLYNAHGTAPGLAIPLSSVTQRPEGTICKWLIMLPGPPRELHPMFEKQVLPMVQREFASALPILDCRVLRVVGIGESTVESMVAPVLPKGPELEIGYCARPGEVDVRLVVRGADASSVRSLADGYELCVRKALGGAIFASGEARLEEALVGLLREKGQTLATAESCTGGYLAHCLTMVPGSSQVFKEGWITYCNAAKARELHVPGHLLIEHGAVSEPVAAAMAEGALAQSEADHAISVTGIAGPDGGTPEKPVGTVFIGLASKGRPTQVEKFLFPYDRETFKSVTAQSAMNMLRKALIQS